MSTLSTAPLLPPPAADAPAALPHPLAYGRRNAGDRRFFGVVTAGVLFVPVLVILFMIVLLAGAWPAFREFGLTFLRTRTWDANAEGGAAFGALPFIYGTLVTGVGALLVAAPIGIAVAT